MRTVTIPADQYKCLREHLQAIDEILGVNGSKASERVASVQKPKETKTQKVKKYSSLLCSGERVKKPNHLKK